MRLGSGVSRDSRKSVPTQNLQQLLNQGILVLSSSISSSSTHMLRNGLIHQPLPIDNLGPRPIIKTGITQPQRLPTLSSHPRHLLEIVGPIGHHRQWLIHISTNQTEPPDLGSRDTPYHAVDESASRLFGRLFCFCTRGGGGGQPAVHNQTTALSSHGLLGLFFAVVGEHGYFALSGDAHPGAVGGSGEVAGCENVGVWRGPPVCGGCWATEVFLFCQCLVLFLYGSGLDVHLCCR